MISKQLIFLVMVQYTELLTWKVDLNTFFTLCWKYRKFQLFSSKKFSVENNYWWWSAIADIAKNDMIYYIQMSGISTYKHTQSWNIYVLQNSNRIKTNMHDTMYDFQNSTDTLKFWTEKWTIKKTFLFFIWFWWNVVKL